MTSDELNRRVAEERGWTVLAEYTRPPSGYPPNEWGELLCPLPQYDRDWSAAGPLLDDMVVASWPSGVELGRQFDGGRYCSPAGRLGVICLGQELPEAIRNAYAEWKGLTEREEKDETIK